MSDPSSEFSRGRTFDDLASLVARCRAQIEPCDIIPDELRLYPAEEVLAEAEQLIWRIRIRKRLEGS